MFVVCTVHAGGVWYLPRLLFIGCYYVPTAWNLSICYHEMSRWDFLYRWPMFDKLQDRFVAAYSLHF